ncbi:ArsR/SmtB family transcription factor [Spelaeicoccus albus]|uniref:Putative transcriptional regulator n=1 Tax=Spelaeicoccus albus TaxID=1280376 RepID=A0A7Z0D4K3_9MICO|nr:helix-turn-helix domain-containing protein [Spelaeicoccus albus]NYI68738.1 putative transcriptional regulator [Spelaeicoccus albus]
MSMLSDPVSNSPFESDEVESDVEPIEFFGLSHESLTDPLYNALVNPCRRAILTLLCKQRDSTLEELAAELPSPGVSLSEHIKVLVDAGTVAASTVGDEIVYTVNLDTLTEIAEHLNAMRDTASASR